MALNGIRGIALAALLGPEAYGIFGTLIIVQQCMSYVALGAREGLVIKLARASEDPTELRIIHSSAVAWACLSGLSTLVALYFLHFIWRPLTGFFVWVWIISALSIVNEIFINISRHENRLKKIALIELLYNGTVLGMVMYWQRAMAIETALHSVLIGLILGVSVYVFTIREISWASISLLTVRGLIAVGIVPAVFSAITVVTNSLFVLAANWLNLGPLIGQIVFANNISALILFGLSTLSWALTSRSMRRLYTSDPRKSAVLQNEVPEMFFRFGVVVTVLLALCGSVLFRWTMNDYAPSATYIVQLCLFQSYGFLLFSELNYLNVNSRLRPIIYGYTLMIVLLVAICLVFRPDLSHLVLLGTLSHFVLAVFIAAYCRRVGLGEDEFAKRVVVLSFPVVCAVMYGFAGSAGAASVCLVFGVIGLYHYSRLLSVVFGRRFRKPG